MVIIGAVLILAPIFLFLTLDSINRQKESTIDLLKEKGAALIRSFEAGARTGMMGMRWGGAQVQSLLSETAQQPDIAYILITNVPFSSIFQSGTHDQLTKIANNFSPAIMNIAVWGANDLIGFIQKYTAIRNAFPQFLTPNDVIAAKNNPETANNTELSAANIPDTPVIEIKRDAPVNYIARKFNSDCQKQIVVGPPQTGKTVLLSQFVRQYSDRTISYFITSSPLTQGQYTFLFSLSKQISKVLGKQSPRHDIRLESLKSLFSELWNSLHRRAKSRKVHYFMTLKI